MIIFKNRKEAGKLLAKKLITYKNQPECIVIGLPRGGVVTAYEIAQELNLPLDIIVPRKIGAPFNPELAVGALTEDGQVDLDKSLMRSLNISENDLTKTIEDEKKEAQRRLGLYRHNKSPRNLQNKIVILVDDGIATGATIKASIKSIQKDNAQKIIVAVPVAPPETVRNLKQLVDEIICLLEPENLGAIGQFYEQFGQTSDEEVITLLK